MAPGRLSRDLRSSPVPVGAAGRPAWLMDEVSDLLMLAAASRAERHSHTSGAPWSAIVQHLGFPQGTPRVGSTRAQVDALVAAGVLECSTGRGTKKWLVTSKGRRRLSRARVQGKAPELPEAPQLRRWRTANEEAKERIDGLGTQVQQTLTQAQQLVRGNPGGARDWAALSMTLRRQCAQLAWATYCLHDWPEPDDAHADVPEAARRRKLGLGAADLTGAFS
jgi:hypothetical protein